MTASLYALKIRIMSFTYIGLSCENNTVRNHNNFLMAISSSDFRMRSSWKCDFLAPTQKWSLFSTPWNVAGLVTWTSWLWWKCILYRFWNLSFKKICPLGMPCLKKPGMKDPEDRGAQLPCWAQPPRVPMNVATWMSPSKISRTTQPTESWKNNKPQLFSATKLWGGLLHSNR